MLINKVRNTRPVAVHLPGYRTAIAKQRFVFDNERKTAEAVVPDNVALVTWNSKPEISILEEQCARLQVGLEVLGRNEARWFNGNKAVLLSDYAQTCAKPYIVALDAYDVLLQGDLSNCVDLLLQLGCESVFCAMKMRRVLIMPNILDFEQRQYRAPFQYLNGGMLVAKTEFFCTLPKERFVDVRVEELVWHNLHHELWPKIRLDDGCEVFSMMNACAAASDGD